MQDKINWNELLSFYQAIQKYFLSKIDVIPWTQAAEVSWRPPPTATTTPHPTPHTHNHRYLLMPSPLPPTLSEAVKKKKIMPAHCYLFKLLNNSVMPTKLEPCSLIQVFIL